MVISELEYLRARSLTKARPFWLTKSTMARRRSSFRTEVRLFAMVAYDHIRTDSLIKEKNGWVAEEMEWKPPDQRKAELTHDDGLDQIARAVDVEALPNRNVVRKQLQRH